MTRYNIDGFFDAIENSYYWRVFDNFKQDYVHPNFYSSEIEALEDCDILNDAHQMEMASY